mmetsp:Transcript_6479/g.10599  ORF Transcript_6479/g.10599 Transcript_6479/m.10599 type:complete len:283 (+) Transcript_6479:48-896(+)
MIVALLLLAFVASASSQVCNPKYGNMGVNFEVTAPDVFLVNLDVIGASSTVVIEVNRTWSPIGVDHFYTLLLDHYYDCAAVLYIDNDGYDQYIQMGIAASPQYTSKWDKYISDDDATVARHSNTKYTISYVPYNGYGTRSTYIMINLKDNTHLDSSGYYPFGQVVSGFDALADISAENFEISDEAGYWDGGSTWLHNNYEDGDVQIISSMRAQSGTSSSSKSADSSGPWVFSVFMVLVSSAACVYAAVYIHRYFSAQQGYGIMSDDSERSTDHIMSLHSREL